jgi:hypothetical protein
MLDVALLPRKLSTFSIFFTVLTVAFSFYVGSKSGIGSEIGIGMRFRYGSANKAKSFPSPAVVGNKSCKKSSDLKETFLRNGFGFL